MGDCAPSAPDTLNGWGRVPMYALYPGAGRLSADGDLRRLGPAQLADLYDVDLRDCLVVYTHELDEPWNKGRREQAAKLPALRPREDGKYSRPPRVPPVPEPAEVGHG